MATKQQLLQFWKTMGVDEKLLQVFGKVPRESFIPASLRAHAYDDHPLPTVRNQSISQPSTVMIMLKALDLQPGEKVFEVGAGVGYQAAIMAHLVGKKGKIITSEVIPELVQFARSSMDDFQLRQARVLEGDGAEGYAEEAPYDKIIITAACPEIPPPLIKQLKEGGVIVAPVGDLQSQTLVKAIKVNGKLELEFLGDFVFVPLMGKYGFEEKIFERSYARSAKY
jgi:protein-L-isoaspartate(D-aspartate) O-methyltransferase